MLRCDKTGLDWRSLTSLAKKQELYAEDSFFREGLSDVIDAWGNEAERCLHRTALILFKPDAIGGRRVLLTTRLLGERGLRPVAAECIAFSSEIYHGLYRYQLRRGTLDKVRLYTRWAAGLSCLVVAYHDVSPRPGIPGSVRFKMMKGHALVDRRHQSDLRTLLQSSNSIANFIHAADEPADVVREVPICIPAVRRANFLQAIRRADADTGAQTLQRLVTQVDQAVPEHDVSPVAAGRRIRAKAVEIAGADGASVAIAMIDSALRGETVLRLRAFENALEDVIDSLNSLDVFIFASQFIARDLPGERGELDEDCVTGWLSSPDTAAETR
jgi:hypothetical protein